ncbi:hypothetical protein MKQ70_02030 [Chitinophaga sedimenti]|uniref:SecDF P1 head subdomain-containing protein n=1 Tax=Chitinophaga sedimenti TaxID=2033606 RepID=UPI002004E1A7|nr:hypothetical protein [Chitinophaga sedimenti]MCK7553848.1 hypothetical protein [Chitinophaga sedimenti]
MQLKGLVKVFAVALILISLYQLSFTFVVRNYEKKINQQAENDVAKNNLSADKKYPNDKVMQSLYADTLDALVKARRQYLIDSTSGEEIAGFPWFVTYTKAKERELNLGLDLQGGMNVVLDVSVEDVIRSLSGYSKDPAFNQALLKARELKKTSQSDYVTLFGEAYAQVAPNGRLSSIFANASQKELTFNSSNEEVLRVIRSRANDAIKNTYLVLQKRIDKFGVAQPNISLDENKGIISVELAGVDDADRVRKYLQASANLEFREVYKNSNEFANQTLVPVNDAVKNYLSYAKKGGAAAAADTAATVAPAAQDTTPAVAAAQPDTSATGSLESMLSKDSGAIAKKLDSAKNMDKPPEPSLFSVMVPLVNPENGQARPGPYFGVAHTKDTATIRSYFSLPAVKNVLPKDFVIAFGVLDEENLGKNIVPVYGLKVNPLSPKAKVNGEMIVDAQQNFDQDNMPEVSMRMDDIGAREWRRLTASLVPSNPGDVTTHNYVAVVLDGIVYSAPYIKSEIAGGSSSISGGFTVDEAKDWRTS